MNDHLKMRYRERGEMGLAHRDRLRCMQITIAVVFSALLLLAPLNQTLAESKTLQWLKLNTDITVQPNGDLRVVETNVIDFTSGTFTFGYRDINQDRLTGITDVLVTEHGQPLQTETSTTGSGDYRIKYYFDAAQNEQRTFELAYTVIGATRYYTNGDVVYWAPVYAARNGFPVQSSTVTVNLPVGASALEVATFGPSATTTGKGEGKVVATAQEPIASGEQFEILVSFPHGIISGAAPAWQAAYDSEQKSNLDRSGGDFGFLLAGLLVLIGGPLAVIVLWFRRGRDPNSGLVADYLNEPPPGIKPGVAGTLVDARADLQDMIATVIDLARRGILSLYEQGTTNAAGVVVSRDYTLARGPHYDTAGLAPYEVKLLDALQLSRSDAIFLSQVGATLHTRLAGIKDAMYLELTNMGLYSHNPEKTRNHFSTAAILLLLFSCVAACVTTSLTFAISDLALCVPAALGVTAIALLVASGGMQARTRKGAETKMRLEAFKRYLQNIEKYTDIKTATDLFDKYLAYAVAFGLDRTWVQKFAAANAPAPTWYIPYIDIGNIGTTSAAHAGSIVAKAALGDVSGAAVAPVSLESINQGLTSSLTDVNKGLTNMFTSVSASFLNKPIKVGNVVGAAAGAASSGGNSSGGGSSEGLEVAGAILGAVLDIAVGGGGSSGGGGGGFG